MKQLHSNSRWFPWTSVARRLGCCSLRRLAPRLEQLEDRTAPAVSVNQVAVLNTFGSSTPSNAVDLNGTVLFYAHDGTDGTELWKSDGSASRDRDDCRH